MTRSDLKILSKTRLKEALSLKRKRCYSGAYYLSGYIIECAIKACIAKKTKKNEFPDKKAADASHKHNPLALIKAAGLEPDLNSKIKSDKLFERYWAVVNLWSEESRYELHDQREAEDLLLAITDPTNGVLQWVQLYW